MKPVRLDTKIDGVAAHLNSKFDSVKDSIATAKVWALTLYIALAAVMLGTLARGFGWILTAAVAAGLTKRSSGAYAVDSSEFRHDLLTGN